MGDTLVEVTLSLAILSIILVTSFSVAALASTTNLLARQRTQAINLLQEQVEALHWYRDHNVAHGQPAFSGLRGPGLGSANSFYMKQLAGVWVSAPNTVTLNADGSAPGEYSITINRTGGSLETFTLTATWSGTASGGSQKNTKLVTNLVDASAYKPIDCSDSSSPLCQ